MMVTQTIAQAVAMGGVEPNRVYVDKGYKGHNYEGEADVLISGQKQGITPTIRRELKRRSAIEPVIGHMKNDGRLDRNFLMGIDGDAINAILAACGYNLRLILKRLPLWLAKILASLWEKMAKTDTVSAPNGRQILIA